MSADFSFTTFLFELEQGHLLGVASLTLFLYDIILTFDQEVALIHQGARWGLPKILYLLNRYYVLLIMIINSLVLFLPSPSDSFCIFATRFSGLGGILAKFILDLWLILRVYAIWGRDQRVLFVLGTMFLANACLCCVMAGISLHALRPNPLLGPRLPGMTGCIVIGANNDFWIVFVSSLIFEVVVFSFTLAKAVMHARAGFSRGDTPLFTHLYRTGVMYFAIMTLTMAFMSATALTPLQDVVLPGQFLSAFVSTVGARMMLAIRAVIKGDDHFSDLRPSDIQISHFHLTPLNVGSGERQTDYPNKSSNENTEPASRPLGEEPRRIRPPSDAWA